MTREPRGLTTERKDNWWVEPLYFAVVLSAFGIYTLWAGFSNANYQFGPYLSPLYSIPFSEPHRVDESWWPFSPAFLVLWIPLGFRATCYYYRRSYFRAFFFDPPACAVGELRKSYTGEQAFPFVLNNLHRYFWYLVVIVTVFLWVDALRAFVYQGRFHFGLGNIVMLVNVVLLSYYTFSCHSFRHLVGGNMDCMSCSKSRYSLWKGVSRINETHSKWAWYSLYSVWFTDIYIRFFATMQANGSISGPGLF